MSGKPTYRAVFEPDDNATWLAHVPTVQGAHSWGRTLRSAEAHLREALALVLDVDEDSFELERDVKLVGVEHRLLDHARHARDVAAKAQAASLDATMKAVNTLSSGPDPLSLRDAADLLGVSFQRVQQLRMDNIARGAVRQNPTPDRSGAPAPDKGRITAESAAHKERVSAGH